MKNLVLVLAILLIGVSANAKDWSQQMSTIYQTSATVSSSTVTLITGNAKRNYIQIDNDSTTVFYISLGTTKNAGIGIMVPSRGTFKLAGDNMWYGTIYGITSSGTLNATITEGRSLN